MSLKADTTLTLCLLSAEVVHIVWRNSCEEVDILVGVELCHLLASGWLGALHGR